jgi:hypothetical protein
MEPNLSIIKWCLPCILICEQAYRKEKNIEHIYITNAIKNDNSINDFNTVNLNKIIKPLEVFIDKKLSIESRYPAIEFMSKHADITVSHQWGNPLNYLYLDLAWMGWPILHNAHLCKDIGYYYEEFDYDSAANILNDIIKKHDDNVDDYINNNRKIIDRYLPSNKELQNKYKLLIDDLYQ